MRLLLACLLIVAATFTAGAGYALAAAADVLLDKYKTEGAKSFNAGRGEKLWNTEFTSKSTGKPVSCVSCHNAEFKKSGKHKETGENIEPLAPSVNRKRLTDTAFIEKWLKRNCKGTLGRECTPQEKGDLLLYIKKQ
ncbi:MAG: DUF1924 domain-containing protein [Nitrospinae bacterium]|nr:DUF1924 domain-containing protein [Nitrospinota bacterium]